MAPRSANRNPETRKPARALPPPGARVSSVLPAKSTVFDCIIPGRQVGQAIAYCRLLEWAFGPRNFMEKVGQAGYPLGPPANFSPANSLFEPAVGRREGLRPQLSASVW